MTRSLEESLGCFVAVAESRSFTHAAKQLGVSQPAVSVTLRELEKQCQTPLFERTSRVVTLTPAGRALLPAARSLLQSAADARATIQGLRPRTVNTIRFDAASILDDYRWMIVDLVSRLHADVEWAFETSYHPLDKVRKLLSHEMDFSVIWGDYPQTDTRRVHLCRAPMGLAVPRTSPLAAKEVIEASDLADMTVAIAPPVTDRLTYQDMVDFAREAGATVRMVADYSREGLLMTPAVTGIPTIVCSNIFPRGESQSDVVFRPFASGYSVDFYIASHVAPRSALVDEIWGHIEEFFYQPDARSDSEKLNHVELG